MLASDAVRAIPLALLLALPGFTQQVPAQPSVSVPSQNTLFVRCPEMGKSKHVLSPISVSEGGFWRAYVEVDVPSDSGCMHTTRLWVARADAPYRLIYFMPPMRTALGNGMEILGWARNSRMLLAMTEGWQMGSDAPVLQQVLAIDAGTGMVYQPDLEAMIEAHGDKQCAFGVTDAGFSADKNVDILVRAQFYTAFDADETEKDVPPEKRCEDTKETWSFNFAAGEIKKVTNAQPLLLFKKTLPNRRKN